jgi:hypothetical protein
MLAIEGKSHDWTPPQENTKEALVVSVKLLHASQAFTCFPEHLVGWFDDSGPSADLLISSADLDEADGLDLDIVLLFETSHEQFR